MRMSTRLEVQWEDESTLVINTDHGRQQRVLRFDAPQWRDGDRLTWQGDSVAQWRGRTLEVVTRNMRLGYLRRNGVSYSRNVRMHDGEILTICLSPPASG
jgi:hypothetical protein